MSLFDILDDDSIDVGFLPVDVTADEIRDAVRRIEQGGLAQNAIELAMMENSDE